MSAGRRWLVTGAAGQLGEAVVAALAGADVADVVALDRAGLDITDAAAVRAAVAATAPALVVNAAGWTDVDGAESAEAAAAAVNAAGPGHLAAACAAHGALLLHISSDYVFAGRRPAGRPRPYPEGFPVDPLSAYGRTKAAGERAVLACRGGYVVRTAWLYRVDRAGFVATMAARAGRGEPAAVVDDQHGSPTWAPDLAAALVGLGTAALGRGGSRPPAPGVYHARGGGATTWYRFARAIYSGLGADPDLVRPTGTAALARPAARPGYAVLGLRRWRAAGLPPLPPWRRSLAAALAGSSLPGPTAPTP